MGGIRTYKKPDANSTSQLYKMYTRLQSAEEGIDTQDSPSIEIRFKQRSKTAAIAKGFALLLAASFAVWGMLDVFTRVMGAMTDPSKRCWCGDTNEEAIRMGCVYDHLAVDWLQPRCVDAALTREFDAAGPGPNGTWSYYVRNNIPPFSPAFVAVAASQVDELARQGRSYYATTEWHVEHCLFTWRKQFRAIRGKVELEPWNDHEEHVEHCRRKIMDILRRGIPLNGRGSKIPGTNRHTEE